MRSKLFILLSIVFFNLKAQITLSSNITTGFRNINYTLPLVFTNANGHYFEIETFPGSRHFYSVFKSAGKWYIYLSRPESATHNLTEPLYVCHTSLNSQYPPCNASWEIMSGISYFDPSYPDIPFGYTGSYTNINISSPTFMCNACAIQSPQVMPKIFDLPILNQTDRDALTSSDGLREGSMIWNCSTKQANIYTNCLWKCIKLCSIYNTTVTHAQVGYQNVVQMYTVTFSTTVPQSLISSHKIQYRNNHSDWVELATLGASQYTISAPTNSVFTFLTGYKLRVVTITNCGEEVVSCAIPLPHIPRPQNTPPFNAYLGEFDLGTAVTNYITAGSSSGPLLTLNITVEKNTGPNTWTTLQTYGYTNVSLPFSLDIPTSNMVLGGKYRIQSVSNSYGTNSELVYKKLESNCPEN